MKPFFKIKEEGFYYAYFYVNHHKYNRECHKILTLFAENSIFKGYIVYNQTNYCFWEKG